MFRSLLLRRDFYAGTLLILLGGGAILGVRENALGTLMHMGAGFFPTALGVILILLGIMIAGSALAPSDGEPQNILPDKPEWWGWACILAGPLLFILFGEYGGMAPATFACVFVAALGDRTATLKTSFLLALGITVFGCALFHYILHVPFPIIRGVNL